MEFRKQRLSSDDAKEMDMVDYLLSLGFNPIKIRNNDYWYLSPIRNEKTPSFKINRKLNRWYDHGLGKGGNLIDFGMEYFRCSFSEFMHQLNGNSFFQKPLVQPLKNISQPESKIKVLSDHKLTSVPLLNYLAQRQIPSDIAKKYCCEIRYELNGKTYYGIGFKNDLGGWEIRNPYFKASSSPKHITTFKNESNEVVVFEGFTDFLSFISLHKNLPENRQDIVVLNSVSFFERARPFMENHHMIRLYLDRDITGQNCIRRALSMSNKYSDESSFYENHKDLNEWLVNSGNPQKKVVISKLK